MGDTAVRQAHENSKNTFYATKRLIGRDFEDPEVAKEMEKVSYKIVRGPNGEAWVESWGNMYSPTQIASWVLADLKEGAQEMLDQKIDRVVLSVPAGFTNVQRQEMVTAGKMAGLTVERLINQSTAAALAYGMSNNDGQIAVVDIGGGTFEAAIVKMDDGVTEVKAIASDTFLGGEDFDNVLVKYLNTKLIASGVKIPYDVAVQQLKDTAENAKMGLDEANATNVRCYPHPEDLDYKVLTFVCRDFLNNFAGVHCNNETVRGAYRTFISPHKGEVRGMHAKCEGAPERPN